MIIIDSLIGWMGGKKLLRKQIVERFPQDLKRYVEVFGGAGWVLFHKDKHADHEVYNDLNGELVNLFKCVKYHADAVSQELSFLLSSREMFEDYKAQIYVRGLTDIQRAARFFVLVKASYACKRQHFAGSKTSNFNVNTQLQEIQERLKRVTIENKTFDELIRAYDRPDTLFFCDPPYYLTENYYGSLFDRADHEKLYNSLANIKGKFLLTYNDCDYIRNLYSNYTIESVARSNNLSMKYKDADKQYKEIIITNY